MGKSFTLTPQLQSYIIDHSVRDTEVGQRLREHTAGLQGAVMQISPEQGQFMGLLVKMLGAKRILELGTFTGYSSLVMAQNLSEDGKIITCDIDEANTAIAKDYWQQAGVIDKIECRLGPALETLEGLLAEFGEGSFDFAFIDADKRNMDAYYEFVLRLLRPGGVVALDNVLWSGRVMEIPADSKQTEAIQALNRKVHQDERVDMAILPIGDGLTLATKR
ncbi:MAG: SAM-dependent methyltransferase [Legionellales bacterium]|nr:SAM-dependent methyltransferase [Legionellales bacterium]